MSITSADSTVQAIFALHVATAGLAFLLLVATGLVFLRQLKTGSARPGGFARGSMRGSDSRPHSSLGTHFWLMSALFNLMVAYAAQAAIVALQTRINSPYTITSAYSYPRYGVDGTTGTDNYGKDISILSFLYQFARILLDTSIIGIIWTLANHMQSNATRMRAPGILSWILNLFWMAAILGLGFASWGLGFLVRGSGNTARYYLDILHSNFLTRALYIAYVATVIAASTSVTVEAMLCAIGAKKNGITGSRIPKLLLPLAFLILPLIWVRNAFSIAQLVLLYRNVNSWSRTTNQALAFLFIIFGQLTDLGVLTLLFLVASKFKKVVERRSWERVNKRGEEKGRISRDDRRYSHGSEASTRV